MSLSERLKLARKRSGLKQGQVVEQVEGLSQSAYSQLESGKTKNTSKMYELSRVLGVNPDWLATGTGSMTDDTLSQQNKSHIIDGLKAQIAAMQTGGVLTDEQVHNIVDTVRVAIPANDVPLISWVAAGSWSEVSPVTLDDALGYYPRPRNLSADGFALKVRGRSMWPEFKPDDIIYVEPNISTLALKDGDLIVVQCNDDTEATFKQLVLGETESDMYLKPLNPDWPEQKMLPMGECRLVGKVVGKLVEY